MTGGSNNVIGNADFAAALGRSLAWMTALLSLSLAYVALSSHVQPPVAASLPLDEAWAGFPLAGTRGCTTTERTWW